MARLDVRIHTNLESRIIYASRNERIEESVTIRELSISGALVYGLTTELKDLFTVRPKLPRVGEIELQAKIIRSGRGKMAISFFYSDKRTMQLLWNHVRQSLIPYECCPYCGYADSSLAGSCFQCNSDLDFANEAYLERHIVNTVAQRLQIRLSRLNLEHFQRIIQFVDSKILKIQNRSPDKELIGKSLGMQTVFSMIRKVAPTEMNVLLLGESGTGKELTVKAIHNLSARRDGPLVAVNCAAIPDSLLESELFGFEKGAFTNAFATKIGKFELADGGTLFLDEIGDLPLSLQAKLLRFLEDRIVERIGSLSSRKIDVRIVAATHRDLQHSIANMGFRSDLFYRLNSISIKLPPLRERGEDKVLLARYFLKKYADEENGPIDFTSDALDAIRKHSWPGNVREMENKIRRGVLMATEELVDAACMDLSEENILPWTTDSKINRWSHKELVAAALEHNNYVIAKAARELKISRPSLYALIKKYSISISRSM